MFLLAWKGVVNIVLGISIDNHALHVVSAQPRPLVAAQKPRESESAPEVAPEVALEA